MRWTGDYYIMECVGCGVERELSCHEMCTVWGGEGIIMPWNVYSVGWRGNYHDIECVGSRM